MSRLTVQNRIHCASIADRSAASCEAGASARPTSFATAVGLTSAPTGSAGALTSDSAGETSPSLPDGAPDSVRGTWCPDDSLDGADALSGGGSTTDASVVTVDGALVVRPASSEPALQARSAPPSPTRSAAAMPLRTVRGLPLETPITRSPRSSRQCPANIDRQGIRVLSESNPLVDKPNWEPSLNPERATKRPGPNHEKNGDHVIL